MSWLLAVAEGSVARALFHVVHVETDLDAHRRFVGQPLGNALGLIILGFADLVAQIFQTGRAVEVLNGEHGAENAFQPHFRIAFLAALLQKYAVGIDLKVQKMRNGKGDFDCAKLLRKLTHLYLRMCCPAPCRELTPSLTAPARASFASAVRTPAIRYAGPTDTPKKKTTKAPSARLDTRRKFRLSVTVSAWFDYSTSLARKTRPCKNNL